MLLFLGGSCLHFFLWSLFLLLFIDRSRLLLFLLMRLFFLLKKSLNQNIDQKTYILFFLGLLFFVLLSLLLLRLGSVEEFVQDRVNLAVEDLARYEREPGNYQ